MGMGNTTLFGMMTEKMTWLGQRQRVLAQNVANADTPDYNARDLKPLNFKDSMSRQAAPVSLAVSDPRHVALPQDTARFRENQEQKSYEVSIDENSVVLEEQMMKLSQTAGDFTLATNIYRKYMQLHRAALGRGGQGG